MAPTFYMATLGCPKNRVDSERIWAVAALGGLVAVDEPAQADVIMINTCAFIEPAVRESLEKILELARHKKGRCRHLAVLGCLPARYGERLREELAEVDFFAGPGDGRLFDWLRSLPAGPKKPAPLCAAVEASPRANSLSPGAAYLKVAEGCSRRCSFCLIPRLRGPLCSRPPEELVQEAAELAAGGVKELNLVAQDLGAWGKDLGGRQRLPGLVDSLARVPGIEWLRLMYLYPGEIDRPLLSAMRRHPNVLLYLDIPFQHVDARLLKKMRRGGTARELKRLVKKLRRSLPGVVLRTTLMTGFPGEDGAAFARLERFVEESRFERLGVFVFSPEEGTEAAGLEGRVARREALRRRGLLLRRQRRISLAYHRTLLGHRLRVLVESERGDGRLVGRAWCQAPEVDGETLLRGRARPGELVWVRITRAQPYRLEGEVVESPTA